MASPFALYANLTVLFDVPTGLETIGANGGPVLGTEQKIAIAYAKRQEFNRRESSEALKDGELSRIWYKGYWVLPMVAYSGLQAEQIGKAYNWYTEPGTFRLPEEGWATIADYDAFVAANSDRIVAQGDFVLAPTPPKQFGVEAIAGFPFSGYLLTQVAWSDAL